MSEAPLVDATFQMGRYLNGPSNRLEHVELFETLHTFAEDLSKALAQNEERAEKVGVCCALICVLCL